MQGQKVFLPADKTAFDFIDYEVACLQNKQR